MIHEYWWGGGGEVAQVEARRLNCGALDECRSRVRIRTTPPQPTAHSVNSPGGLPHGVPQCPGLATEGRQSYKYSKFLFKIQGMFGRAVTDILYCT